MTLEDLRDSLVKDLKALRSGDISTQQAKARANLAKNILDTFKIELLRASMLDDGAKLLTSKG